MEEKIGEGTYGTVYKAVRHTTQQRVAIKKIRIQYDDEGVPPTAMREISLLKETAHPNVIPLHDVLASTNWLYLIFECLDMDLRVYMKRNGPFSIPAELRKAAHQLFVGIAFCHGHRVLHRDLKPQNILVDVATMRLKLADFGLARTYSVPIKVFTHEVITLWYRCPEILMGQEKYATSTDIWSLGCILSEMATGQALFPGDSEIDTLFRIFRQLGTPTEQVWPGVTTLRDYKQRFPKWTGDTNFTEVLRQGPSLRDDGVEFLKLCLKYNPVDRPAACRLLTHAFFEEQRGSS